MVWFGLFRSVNQPHRGTKVCGLKSWLPRVLPVVWKTTPRGPAVNRTPRPYAVSTRVNRSSSSLNALPYRPFPLNRTMSNLVDEL